MPKFLDKVENTLNNYVADAKDIKGGFAAIDSVNDLTNLPSACKVLGSLVYCRVGNSNNHYGLYMYTGAAGLGINGWVQYSPEQIVFNCSLSEDFDTSNSYGISFTSNQLQRMQSLEESNQNFLIKIIFINSGVTLYFSPYNITAGFIGIEGSGTQSSFLFVKDNKQYLALLTHDSLTIPEYTLSFQELQAGSSGGIDSSHILYHIEVEDDSGNKAIIPISQSAFTNYITELNQVGAALEQATSNQWTNISTIGDLKLLFDDLKEDSQLSFACDLAMNLLVKYAYNSGENPLLVFTDNTREQAKVVNEMLNYDLSSLQTPLAYPLGAITSVTYDPESIQVPDTQVGLTQLYLWFKAAVGGTSIIEIDEDATFTYTEEQVAVGSGSNNGSSAGTSTATIEIKKKLIRLTYSKTTTREGNSDDTYKTDETWSFYKKVSAAEEIDYINNIKQQMPTVSTLEEAIQAMELVLSQSISDFAFIAFATNFDYYEYTYYEYDFTSNQPSMAEPQILRSPILAYSDFQYHYHIAGLNPLGTISEITLPSGGTFTHTITEETEFEQTIQTGGGSNSNNGDSTGSGNKIYTFRLKANTPPMYEFYSIFSTIDEYIDYYIEDTNNTGEYILVTNDNKNNLGIIIDNTSAYTQNTLPNVPYVYLYFDINETYFNNSGFIKDFNLLASAANMPELHSLDELASYWNNSQNSEVGLKGILVNTFSEMGYNFIAEMASNDIDTDGNLFPRKMVYLESSSGDSISWTGLWGNSSGWSGAEVSLDLFANEGVMELVGTSGGGSNAPATGGSGKLYQLDLQLTRYDNDGETVVKWGDSLSDQLPSGFSSELVLNYFPIKLLLSETKVEAFKAFINPIIDTFNNQAQIQISHVTNINDIVSLLNTYVIADFSLGRLFLNYLIQFSDTALLHYLIFGAEYAYNITSNATGSILGLSSKNNSLEISSDYNPEQGVNHDCVYSINNTCTLTEYGTSSGNSGEGNGSNAGIDTTLKIEFTKSLIKHIDAGETDPETYETIYTEETVSGLKDYVYVYFNFNDAQSLLSGWLGEDLDLEASINAVKNGTANQTQYMLFLSLIGYGNSIVSFYYIESDYGMAPIIDQSVSKVFNVSFGPNNTININREVTSNNAIGLENSYSTYTLSSITNVILEKSSSGSSSASTTGCSGKLYEITLPLTRYDDNGDAVTASLSPNLTVDTLQFLIYESNFERFKYFASTIGITLNTIQDLIHLINITLMETTATTSNNTYSLFVALAINSDKIIGMRSEDGTTWNITGDFDFEISSGSLLNGVSFRIPLILDDTSSPFVFYGLNANDSCTLKEYGTSGSSSVSSTSEPSIPQRLTFAYNLVVNINQQQFTNGSWTGTPNSDIRVFYYNGTQASKEKAEELVEFLTGTKLLDEYNATKPTPCFVFCTQHSSCWKLQWDGANGLRAYRVNNFPLVTKKKYYNIVLQEASGSLNLQLNIPYEKMEEVFTAVNSEMGTSISSTTELIALYDSLKSDNLSSQYYQALVSLFTGFGSYSILNNLATMFYNYDGAYKITGAEAGTGLLYKGNNHVFSDDTSASNFIHFLSTSTLAIFERDNPNELD